MKLGVYQFVLLVCILEKKSECVQSCRSREYYSEDIPGCIGCPSNCDDQDARDIGRCKKACEKKTISTPPQIKTEVTKSDTAKLQSTMIPSWSKIPPTTKENNFKTTVAENVRLTKTTRRSADFELSEKASATDNSGHLGLVVSLGVLGTFMVCLVLLGAYLWQCSRTSGRESYRDVEQVEISTSSQESSPVARRLHGENTSSVDNIDVIRSPLQETEEGNLISPVPDDNYMSSLNLEQTNV